MQDWSSRELPDEIDAALEEYVGPDRTMDDADLQIFMTWFQNDRQVRGGGTPAERYAARSDIPAEEAAAAARIASASLGVHRVLAVEPGSALALEDIVRGGRVHVRSANVSRDAVRWDILIGRIMPGDPATLWGPTRFLEPSDEPDLIGELERLTGGEASAPRKAEQALRDHALELMRFRPSSWDVEPSFFTLEGDPLVEGSATWRVRDAPKARERFRALAGLAPDEPLEIDITAPRDQLVASRPELPPGALVLEATAVGDLDTIAMAGLRLEGEQLHVEAVSEERLDRAIEIVGSDFGELVELHDRQVVPIERRLAERGRLPPDESSSGSGLPPAEERRLAAEAMTERMRRWLDEPHPQLGGSTPRRAAGQERRAEVVSLVRGLENRSERARRDGRPFADVTWMREELGLGDELAA